MSTDAVALRHGEKLLRNSAPRLQRPSYIRKTFSIFVGANRNGKLVWISDGTYKSNLQLARLSSIAVLDQLGPLFVANAHATQTSHPRKSAQSLGSVKPAAMVTEII